VTIHAVPAAAPTLDMPAELAINAWAGAAVHGPVDANAASWGVQPGMPHSQQAMTIDDVPDDTKWSDVNVGYGILLLDDDKVAPAVKAAGGDAPAPIQQLLAARPGTVVLRWSKALNPRVLRRYFADGTSQDPAIGLSRFGTDKGRLPRYILIAARPDQIPWQVQYTLAVRHAVGRLPMDPGAAGPYVSALIDTWKDTPAQRTAPLIWSVDQGDITSLMRTAVAGPLASALIDPRTPGTVDLNAAAATGTALLTALRDQKPGLLVTSSHGQTSPLDNSTTMAAGLGLPVDAEHNTVPLGDFSAAVPAGAIWYANACCSAGSDATSRFAKLLAEGGDARRVLEAVAALGSTTAPAPAALLSRPAPVRAVIGHVEPTFDWTLRVAETGQALGHDLVAAFSAQLYAGRPIGLALGAYWSGVGQLHSQWADARDELAPGDVEAQSTLVRLQLTARDRQSLVLLGDPTVTLAPA